MINTLFVIFLLYFNKLQVIVCFTREIAENCHVNIIYLLLNNSLYKCYMCIYIYEYSSYKYLRKLISI